MSNRNFRQSVAVFVLVACLGSPLASSAAPLGSAGLLGKGSVSSGVATWLWEWFLEAAWAKEGCSIDPFGRCATGSLEGTDNGCRIDPDGLASKEGCRIDPSGQSAPKEGCRIDPDGRCIEESTTKNGCLIDPNGRCIPGP